MSDLPLLVSNNEVLSRHVSEMLRVAIYVRLSEEDRVKRNKEDDSISIQNQKNMLVQYAQEQGWEIYDIYNDEDYPGADRKRPEYNRILKDAEKKKFDIILCKTQSRFTRELELVEKYINGLFPLWGIRFVSIVDNADTEVKGNKKSRQINGLVNEWYLEDLSENIKCVFDNRRQNGFHIGAFALYGYIKDPEQKGHLIIDNETAPVVREVFNLYAQGYGKVAIARILNARGIPNPTEYKRLQGLRYTQPKQMLSTLWKYSSISSMLRNEMYIGNMVQGKYGSISFKTKKNKPRPKSEWIRVEGTHEPIIDRALWNKVQKILDERAKPCYQGTVGIFAKKVKCANCGYFMSSYVSQQKHYLRCPSRFVSKDICTGAYISVKVLERTVLAELRRLSAEYLDKDELEQNIEFCGNLENQKIRLLEELKTYEKQIDENTRGIHNLYIDKLKGIISESDFLSLSKQFTDDKKRLEQVVINGEKQLAEIENRMVEGDNRRALIEKYVTVEHLNREIVETMIDYITVGKTIPGTHKHPIEIHWNF